MKLSSFNVAFLPIIVLALGCSGAAPTHQDLFDQMMGSMDQMGTIFAGITDEASANAAKPKMEALAKTINDIKEKGKALGDPPPDLKAKLDKLLAEKQKEMQAKMMTFMMNAAQNPKIMQILEPIMREFGNSVSK